MMGQGIVRAKRPGGRTEKVRRAVAQAALTLIKEGQLTFELQDLARLSGVHRTTIYRRWPDRLSIIKEAFAEHTANIHAVTTGDFRADLRKLAYTMRTVLSDPIELSMNSLIVSTNDTEFQQQMVTYWTLAGQRMVAPIVDAIEKGTIKQDTDPTLILYILSAPILVKIMLEKEVPSDDFLNQLARQLADSCRPEPAEAVPTSAAKPRRRKIA